LNIPRTTLTLIEEGQRNPASTADDEESSPELFIEMFGLR